MQTVRTVLSYLFLIERKILRLYRWLDPSTLPTWIEPALWVTASALLVAIWVLILW